MKPEQLDKEKRYQDIFGNLFEAAKQIRS